MKRLRNKYGIVLVLLVMIAMAGCNLFENERMNPAMPGSSGQLGNFWVGAGIADSIGVYVEPGSFTVNVPRAGVFKLTYTTNLGTYYLVFRSKANSRLFIGLQPGDEVQEAVLEEGDVTNLAPTTPDVQEFGNVSVYYRDGMFGDWDDFITVDPTKGIILLVRDGEVMRDQFGITIGTGSFVVTVPAAGVYNVRYITRRGVFYQVFQAMESASLTIELESGDEVLDVSIEEGDATSLALSATDVKVVGALTIFYWPGAHGSWRDFIVVNPIKTIIVLILDRQIIAPNVIVIKFIDLWRDTPKSRTDKSGGTKGTDRS